MARAILEAERIEGHDRTIVVGDFNMNPFEAGIVGAAGLNATMAKGVALRGFRTVQNVRYPFFYNPMWQRMGDRAGSVSGTYYYDRNEQVTYFWNTFDQVLIRPVLAGWFRVENLRILDQAESVSLLGRDGRPNGTAFSDHLPILFSLGI